jgi:Mn-dependent DtxR family transcriptional regulator
MLDKLLELLQSGGTHRVADLARELETTPALVEAMLEGLCQIGYLKRMSGNCAEGCAGCSLAGLCAAGKGGQVWTLANKE